MFDCSRCNLLWCIGLGILGKSLIGMLYGESYYIGVAPLLICCIRGTLLVPEQYPECCITSLWEAANDFLHPFTWITFLGNGRCSNDLEGWNYGRLHCNADRLHYSNYFTSI